MSLFLLTGYKLGFHGLMVSTVEKGPLAQGYSGFKFSVVKQFCRGPAGYPKEWLGRTEEQGTGLLCFHRTFGGCSPQSRPFAQQTRLIGGTLGS